MKKFPKRLLITVEGTEQEDWFVAWTDLKTLQESDGRVAIYELKAVKTLKITRELK